MFRANLFGSQVSDDSMSDSDLILQALDALYKARDLISLPERWTQHTFARSFIREPVDVENRKAESWCSLGALNKFNANERARSYLAEAAFELKARSFVEYNDRHSHAKVMWMWNLAIRKAHDDSSRNPTKRSRPDSYTRVVDTRSDGEERFG